VKFIVEFKTSSRHRATYRVECPDRESAAQVRMALVNNFMIVTKAEMRPR
jgi:hypothetical protein